MYNACYLIIGRGCKRTHDIVRKRVEGIDPGVTVHLIYAIISLGGQGEITHGLKRQPPHVDVQSHLSGSSAI